MPQRRLPPEIADKVGIRTLRLTLFDNDTRLLFATTFDTDWDLYVDDSVSLMGGVHPWGKFLQHTVECPTDIATPGAVSNAAAKELLNKLRVPATGYQDTFPDVSNKKFHKALRVLAAFEKVLDNPDAEAAFQHPALKPLLDEAAD